MFDLKQLLERAPFSMAKDEKNNLYTDLLKKLIDHHYINCEPYRKILDSLGFDRTIEHSISDIPFLPVSLFKNYELISVEKSEIIKTMTSSGTSGQSVSKICLDRTTATNQSKVLAKIVSNFTGPKRLPTLIIDTKAVLKDPKQFSARGAGILGFSFFGRDVTYALDENMQLDFKTVEAFCARHKGEEILLFGFTYMIWEYFCKELTETKKRFTLDKGILLHGGGWKKLRDRAVDNETFKESLKKACGIKKVHNYYGMVEQTGSIFMECEAGYLHSSIFSDVIIRRDDFSVSNFQEPGLIQLISLLPFSYPGHSILSEDVGEIIGEDNCSCGRLGKYFKVHGRIKDAEIRGCSDTYA